VTVWRFGRGGPADRRQADNIGIKEVGETMRNILITVMMLLVAAVMFQHIIAGDDGTQAIIESHGQKANDTLRGLIDSGLHHPPSSD